IKLLKIGARIQVSVRRIPISLSEAYPFREIFGAVLRNLRHVRPPPLVTS
ncbi:MAG: transposase, partial [Planctomycetaceae bacterium]|nr:transposase [Planctomycetaceae bacterium]